MYENWEELITEVKQCKKCKLCTSRINTVLGKGNKNAKIMFIGEGPGEDEDKQGLPFVGKAGQLFDKALKGVDINQNDIYIANIVKCRPPQNRNPELDEINACLNYLRSQVILIKPKIVVLLGSVALNSIIDKNYSITKVRGKWVEKKGIIYMPTYHPAALLRDTNKKIEFWKDLKLVREKYLEILNANNDKSVE